MNNSLISVVIATYHRGTELKRALKSLSTQTYSNFEVILVDDNNDSHWNGIVKGIVDAETELNIRLIVNSSNKGSAQSRNEGIFSARGNYITFLDDDDVYLPNKLERQVNKITDANADFCITDLFLYNEKDVLTDRRIRSYIKKTDRNSLLVYHLKYHMTGTDTLMFSKEFIQKIGGFSNIDIGDEFYLVLKAIENNCKFTYLPGCDVKAYVHGKNGGISTGNNKINGENALFEKKKDYYSFLSKRDIRFIKMRHNAVIAVANMNMKEYYVAFYKLIESFVNTPVGFVKMFLSHKV